MPTNMEIIRDEVDKDILRHVASAPKWDIDSLARTFLMSTFLEAACNFCFIQHEWLHSELHHRENFKQRHTQVRPFRFCGTNAVWIELNLQWLFLWNWFTAHNGTAALVHRVRFQLLVIFHFHHDWCLLSCLLMSVNVCLTISLSICVGLSVC